MSEMYAVCLFDFLDAISIHRLPLAPADFAESGGSHSHELFEDSREVSLIGKPAFQRNYNDRIIPCHQFVLSRIDAQPSDVFSDSHTFKPAKRFCKMDRMNSDLIRNLR